MTTLSPDVAAAVGVYVPLALPADGAELAEMVLVDVPAAEAGKATTRTAPATSIDVAAPIATAVANTDGTDR
jgi:hypothetical protein